VDDGNRGTGYILSVGTTGAGSYNLYYSGSVTATSVRLNASPANGETIYRPRGEEIGALYRCSGCSIGGRLKIDVMIANAHDSEWLRIVASACLGGRIGR
jgi:hypothetical protein